MEQNENTITGGRARAKRLLLVDDEPMLRFTLRLMLEDSFEVVVADSAAQARLEIDAAPRFDVVLSDMQMPGATGQDLYRWAVEMHPELAGRFVFMTGGACTEASRAFLASRDVVSVEKPFEFDALLTLVVRAANGGGGLLASA
jgi:DNA-binding NtrC family response regulator